MMCIMKWMTKRQDWLVEQTQMMYETQKSNFNKLNVDTLGFQWADWDLDEWMGSESEEEEEEDEGGEE